jgi:hypothetical protein
MSENLNKAMMMEFGWKAWRMGEFGDDAPVTAIQTTQQRKEK